jgi:hypothetical protein
MATRKMKVLAQKFDKTDKATIRGRVKHTRTGACTCKLTQRCQHGKNYGSGR